MCRPYPQRVVNGDYMGAVSRNNCIKKGWSRVGAWTGTLLNFTKCIWLFEPDRSSNFFSLPAYLCAVTCMTKISLIVTLNNKCTSYHRKLFVSVVCIFLIFDEKLLTLRMACRTDTSVPSCICGITCASWYSRAR